MLDPFVYDFHGESRIMISIEAHTHVETAQPVMGTQLHGWIMIWLPSALIPPR